MATFPANTSATATVISSLPFITSGDFGGDPSAETWFAFTTASDDILLGVQVESSAGSGDHPTCEFFATLALDALSPGIAQNDQNAQQPVQPLTTYYFQLTPNNASATITLGLERCPQVEAPAGSFLVTDDALGFPTLILSATTGAVLRAIDLPGANNVAGDILPNGIFVTNEAIGSPTTIPYLRITSPSLELLVRVANPSGTSTTELAASQNDNFYAVKQGVGGANKIVYRFSSAGVVDATTWTLPSNSVLGLGVTPDEETLYWMTQTVGDGIHAFDLIGNVALPDFAAGLPGHITSDLIVLADGSVAILYWKQPAPNSGGLLRHFTADGLSHADYAYGGTETPDSLSRAFDDPMSVVMWTQTKIGGQPAQSIYRRINVPAMTVAETTPSIDIFESGINHTNTSALFGPSSSCPMLVLRQVVAAPAPPVPPEPPEPPDPTAVLGTLVLDVKAKRWFFDEYASPVTTRLWESGEGVEVELLSHADGSLTQGGQSGNGDYGHEIPWLIQVPDFDGNDPRREKLFGDLFLSADPQGSTAGLTVTPGINGFSGVLTPTVIGSGETGRESFIVDINSGLGQRAKNLGLQISGSDLVRPIVYLWEPSLVPKQVLSRLRATDWLDAGRPGAKWIQGLLVQADCDGATRQVQVEYDNGQLSEIFTITDAEESQIPYSFQNPFFAHLMRLRLVDLAEWQFFGAQWFFQPAPELVSTWQTPSTTLGFHGFGQLERILIAHVSTLDFTLDVVGDGIAQSYPVTNSAGIFRKDEVLLAPNKAKAYAFRASTDSGSAGLRLYVQDLEVRGKSYGSPEGYRVLRPFGAESVDPSSAARI